MFFLRSLPLLGLAASATAVLASPLCARGNSYEQHTRKQVEKTFIHPGILHTKADLDRMKTSVAQKLDPWYPAFVAFSSNELSLSTYTMRGPLPYVVRNVTGTQTGKTEFSYDGVAALQNALMYYITGDEAHAIKSTEILTSWANTLQKLNGTDAQLTAGLYGPQFVNAAEIIRAYYSGWASADIDKFKSMVLNVLYPHAAQTWPTEWQKYPFLANWGTSAEKALVAFGVFLDNSTMYHEGLNHYLHHECANITNQINTFGQNSESGRDQGHTSLGLGNMAEICLTAENQGDAEYWGLYEDRLMVGYEYTAKYNLGYDVEYDPGFYRCGANLVGGPWQVISNVSRGQFPPVYEIAYAHYAQKEGKEMPYVREHLMAQSFEQTNTWNTMGDNAVWGTLRFRKLAGNLTADSDN
ncbi:uncharacterized protein LAJ45_08659 [Morchella importuna]|uniref:Chondroitin AC/alginate lyase n=1 Tax=Morchella conica CCBAS932 TaxID=1392247 RepID=A0A3N4L218_9PEZI|nr:uncharacterized protein LAJ45_08659 [Morchella importuna]KAH8147181.1 hypothetical protein LAJ45_08659 [Morchella importuna]RPB15709.1 chondroitin AC/alginate lyase [Morchella conica CCBAS932]